MLSLELTKKGLIIMEKKPVKAKRKKNYLNNADLLIEIDKSHEQDKMTDKLAKMIQLLTHRFTSRGSYSSYSYLDDMRSYAVFRLVQTWSKFDKTKSSNAFSYFTQCISNSVWQYLNKEKRERVIRDHLLIKQGLSPSNTFLAEYEQEIINSESDNNTGQFMNTFKSNDY
jgi:DNA-directed RNA polymerase specialized sigma subunit